MMNPAAEKEAMDLAIRPAGPADARLLWEWANDPTVRSRSFNPQPFPWESHSRWYEKRLDSPDTRFWLLEAGGEPVAQIRYDRDPAGTYAAISFSVAKEHRGKGYGTEIVRRTCARAAQELGVAEVVALVLLGNTASCQAFLRAGFTASGEINVQGRPGYRFTWRRADGSDGMNRSQTPFIEIEGRRIGTGYSPYVIAEMSANHNQSFEQAVQILRAAKAAGADAVKLQTYTADTLTIDSDLAPFQIHGGLWDGRRLYELYQEAYTPWNWQPKLKRVADDLELTLFSTPFDDSAVDFLEEMRVPAYKVASFELVDTALLRRIAKTGKPIIMSTGMATLAEIDEAVQIIRQANGQLALLKCTSAYPAPPEEANLRTIPHLAAAFGVPTGLSDHTLGIAVPVAAVALGACMIEKHFTLSRGVPGPDSAFSLEPQEFKEMVQAVRIAVKALGDIRYEVTAGEAASRQYRRSLFVVKDMAAGETFTESNIRSIRPGYGLPPKYLSGILGRRATCGIPRGTPLNWNLIGGNGGEAR